MLHRAVLIQGLTRVIAKCEKKQQTFSRQVASASWMFFFSLGNRNTTSAHSMQIVYVSQSVASIYILYTTYYIYTTYYCKESPKFTTYTRSLKRKMSLCWKLGNAQLIMVLFSALSDSSSSVFLLFFFFLYVLVFSSIPCATLNWQCSVSSQPHVWLQNHIISCNVDRITTDANIPFCLITPGINYPR